MSRRPERPYPGTRPFHGGDRNWFFGRAAEAAAVAGLWRDNRLTILSGRAGSGKTSLLRAGVLPLVESGQADILPVGLLSGGAAFPLAAMSEHNPYTLALLRSWSPADRPSDLVGRTIREFIQQRDERHGRVILAAIDQAEELLADPGARRAKHQRFIGDLAKTLESEPRLHLLLCARDDSLEPLIRELGSGPRHHLTGLRPEDALEATMRPAQRSGRRFEAMAAEELVADLQTSHIVAADGRERTVSLDLVEPVLLQVVCAGLWASLAAGTDIITVNDMRRYGDADGALATHCGQVIAAAAERHGEPAARLRSWLTRTFITEAGTRDNAYEGTTETAHMPNALARTLEELHLLAAEGKSGLRWYELLSDRLIEPLRRAPEEKPPLVTPGAYLELAQRAQALNDLDLAERHVLRFTRASDGTDVRSRAQASSLLGDIFYERGKPADAEAYYRTAVSLFEVVRDTGSVASQLAAVGQTLLAQGELADAAKQLQAATERSPRDPLLQTEFGWALWQLGEGRTAVRVLSDALALDGGNPEALRARGEILADLGEARAALRDLHRVAESDWPSARAARGLALAEIGELDAASKEIERAIADAPRNGPVLFYASRAEALSGDKAEAAELARRAAFASDPAMPPHQREAARVLAGQPMSDL